MMAEIFNSVVTETVSKNTIRNETPCMRHDWVSHTVFINFLAPITSIMVMDESGAALANVTIEFGKESVQTGCVTLL